MPDNTLNKVKPARYGFAMFGTSIPINMFKSFALAFYVDTLGFDVKLYAKILAIYAIVDAIDNPIYGFLSDNTHTKWGRRRPWLLIGTPLLVLSFIMFFNVPAYFGADPTSTRMYIYVLLMYILTGTLDSLVNANYGALFPELFKRDEERAKTNSFRQICQLFAMAISIALTPIIAGKLGYQLTAIIYGILALIVMMYCFWGCRENPVEVDKNAKKPELFSSMWALATNPKFWIYGMCGAFYSAAFSLISQAIPLYTKYTLNKEGIYTTILLGTVLVVAVAGIVLWSFIVKKWDIMKVWRSGFIIMAISFVPLFFAKSFVGAAIIACFVGFGVAACLATMDCIGAKIVDDDYRRHGIKREGIINSLGGVLNRLNGFYVSFTLMMVAKYFGYESGENPGTNPALASRVLLCAFPAAAMVVATVFAMFLHFNEEKKAVEAEETADENDE